MTESCDYCDQDAVLTKCEGFFLCPVCIAAKDFVLPQLRRDSLMTKTLLTFGVAIFLVFLYFVTRLR